MKRAQVRKLPALMGCFFLIGLVTFGGGLAMMPLLQREVVQRRGWISEAELLDCYAISRCTPGVVAVNTATYVGYRTAGALGGVCATLALVAPSFVIIMVLALFLQQFAGNRWVQHALAGIRAAVAALSVGAVLQLYRAGVKGAAGNALMAAALLLSAFGLASPVLLVLGAVALGLALELARGRRARP